ncbi:nuclear transport factor 2 family protein [Flavobacterium sp. HJJ]|uniref:nuclear transport factor 2 family protein n=1 Tax=Flavobacterium sp. HJJ TaxID=2783792 RepID=UPI00188A5AEF|nr:nuclear transport factor 2 family protein [Flavobacterium sp. HJJ]MBF4470728.1 nuclear transport factor 2 family protein [Flavobacterium sp. HJJ]
MRVLFLSLAVLILVSFDSLNYKESDEKQQINRMLDAWHKAAAEANFDNYFGMMTEDAIFIGTDPSENWGVKAFKAFAKPYFDKGKAWNFKMIERHIYFDSSGKTAWFDELLNTQMKICRGSGVVVKIGKEWKIKHYVLSITIPNDNVDEVVKIIAPIEDVLIQKGSSK